MNKDLELFIEAVTYAFGLKPDFASLKIDYKARLYKLAIHDNGLNYACATMDNVRELTDLVPDRHSIRERYQDFMDKRMADVASLPTKPNDL